MRTFKNKFFLKKLRIGGLSLLFTGLVSMGMAQTPIPYEQDFENDTLGAWQSYSVASNQDWQWGSFGGDGFATVNGFGANESSNDWLISPRFDLNSLQDSVFFRFNNAKNFGDGGLKLVISKNYDGESNPDSSIFNWKDITNRADLVKQQGYVDTPSGRISINDFANEDSVYIAFQYTAMPNNATEWQLDDFRVFQKGALAQVPYEQDFENVNGLDDWQPINLSSSNNWTREDFDGDYFAEMSGFQSDTVNKDWLVSPGFDLSSVTDDYFFSFSSSYDFGGDTFRVKVSTNYDGTSDPTNAEFDWTDITNEFQLSQTGFNEVFSGGYNLSAFNGDTLYIAFQYTAPTNDGGTMQIDDITIQQQDPLVLNEVLANNQSFNTDENGENDAWVELYNPNGTAINLSNYGISDDQGNPGKYSLPDTTIPSKDYVIVWTDGQSSQGGLHTGFSLDASGDELYLSNNTGSVDSVSFGAQAPDTSYGRFPNETGNFQQTFPTPEADNQRLLPTYNIGEVTTVDNQTGEVDSLGVRCKITGIIHGFNRRTDGYEVSLQDSTGGIGLFEFSNVSGYTPEEGDKITVRGEIGQFNGLAQLRPDSIRVVSQDNELYDPVVTDALSEDTEAVLTTLEDYTIIDTSQWGGSSAFNVDITNGTDTFIIRIDEAAPLINQGPALGYFDVTGEGWQFDGSEPYFGGYQVFPESTDAFRYDTNLVVNEFLAVNNSGEADELGEQDPWIELYNKGDEALNPSAYLVSDGSGATEGSRLPDTTIQPGERLTIWADGDPLQQGIHTNFALSSDGGTITLATPYGDVFETVDYGPQSPDTSMARNPEGTGSFGEATPTFDSANENFSGINATVNANLKVYPNPVSDVLNIKTDQTGYQLKVINGKGQVVEQQKVMSGNTQISMNQRPTGLYLLQLQGLNDDWQVTKKIVNTR
jgi:hypothetical protein